MKVRINIREYITLQIPPHLQSPVHFKACLLHLHCLLKFTLQSYMISSRQDFADSGIVIQIGVICSVTFHLHSFGW